MTGGATYGGACLLAKAIVRRYMEQVLYVVCTLCCAKSRWHGSRVNTTVHVYNVVVIVVISE